MESPLEPSRPRSDDILDADESSGPGATSTLLVQTPPRTRGRPARLDHPRPSRPAATRTRLTLPWVLGPFTLLVALVWLVVWWSVLHPPGTAPYGAHFVDGLPTVFRGWAHWDSDWYARIAADGYSYRPGQQSGVAFSPSFPLMIRVVAALFPGHGGDYIAGSIVTLVSGFAAVALLWRWCIDRFGSTIKGRRIAATSVLCLAVYPYSIYLYGPVYADAFFLAGALGAFVLLERDKIWAAAFVGAIASGARPVGLMLAVALVARAAERRYHVEPGTATHRNRLRRWFEPINPRHLHRRDLVLLGSASGFAAYCVYLAARFGDPFAFASVQSAPGWDQGAGPTTWSKVAFFTELSRDPFGPAALGLGLQLCFAVLTLCALPAIARRLGHAYALYVFLLVAVPMIATKDFQGIGRYLLPAFPAVVVAATFVARRRLRWMVVAGAGVPILLLFASWFAKGNYLA